MIAVYKKEMRTYFTHMMGYIFLAFLLLIIGIWFVMENVMGANSNFQFALNSATIFFFILIPLLTMRIFSEETRQKTDQLLFTSPLSILQIVLGKFFAACSLFLFGTGISVILPLILNHYSTPPVSIIVGTYLGFILLGTACIAIGVFLSVLTDNQIIAAVITVAAIFVMFIMDAVARSMPTSTFASFMFVIFIVVAVIGIWYNATRNILATIIVAIVSIAIAGGLYMFNNLIYDGIIVRALLWFSVFARFHSFGLGLIHLSDVIYYISFSALFVYLTVNVIEKRRWR